MVFEAVMDAVQVQIAKAQSDIDVLNKQKEKMIQSFDLKIKAKQAALDALNKQQQNKLKAQQQQAQPGTEPMPDATQNKNPNLPPPSTATA